MDPSSVTIRLFPQHTAHQKAWRVRRIARLADYSPCYLGSYLEEKDKDDLVYDRLVSDCNIREIWWTH